MLRILSLAALALGSAAPALAEAKPGLTATLTVDGKPVALRHVVAIQRRDVFNEAKEAYTLTFTSDPIPAEALKGIAPLRRW